MKKYLLVVLLCSIVFFWCTKKTATIDVNSINDLTTLQVVVTQVSEEMNAGKMSTEQAQDLLDQLQQKYLDLTTTTQKNIELQFETMEKLFDTNSTVSYTLPLWAKKLGMIPPEWMEFSKVLSKHSSNDSWYNSTMLVYKWSYVVAMQQAKRIAQSAHLYVSKEFQKAQSLAQSGDVNYISGLDIDALAKWIVYVNHELLTTNADQLLSVSVDQDWTLIIETIKYK